jgi:uncharacterized membrane protein
MPETLHWFRWESYFTWLTGFLMLSVTYYWSAKGLLIPTDSDLTPGMAICLSMLSLGFGWLIYDRLCKSPLKAYPAALFTVLFLAIVLLSWAYAQVFTERAAWLHTGALIATMMSGNVFFVIIPNSRIVVADLKAGRVPDAIYGQIAKLRSTHNNYLTLPVVVLMISNHTPLAFGHPYAFVLVAIILALGVIIRDWFNAHEAGIHGPRIWWQWPLAGVCALAMILFSAWRPDQIAAEVDVARALTILETHCTTCHAEHPAHDAFDEAPGGIMFETIDDMRAHSAKIMSQAVLSSAMPLGNETGMTDEERAVLGAWLRAGAPSDP